MTKPAANPTDAELTLLGILWHQGPSTVRAIHEALPQNGTGYTTTLKLLQKMHEKGLVRRDESQRSHVYEAVAPEQTQKRLIKDFLQRAFAGSSAKLVMRALDAQPATPEELSEIRRLLDALEEKPRRRQ